MEKEYSTASNIKNRQNRHAVQASLKLLIHKMKMTKPQDMNVTGIAYFSDCFAECVTLIPPKPITECIYKCDKKFHTECLIDLYKDHDCYGAVFITGTGCIFYEISGTATNLLEKFKVKLPNEHSRGGQSQNRISHLRDEAIHNYITKCVERTNKYYIENGLPSIKKLIIAGPAEKKILLQNRLIPHLKDICVIATHTTEENMLENIAYNLKDEDECQL